MPLSRSSIFLEVIEGLSKNSHITEGDAQAMAKEILYQASHFLKIDRVNSWLMDEDGIALESLAAFDRKTDQFYTEDKLLSSDFPNYFSHICRNDIIISTDAQAEPFNAEILESYLIPHHVLSMMEVPLLSGGKLKGILCFENTEELRAWTNDEQHFALALTQLLNLMLETREKNKYRDELELMVKEKSVLIAEINHRVKNNLAVITALIRSEANRSRDAYHKELFDNVLSKSFSLSTLQNAMFQSQNYKTVNFSEFVKTMIGNMNDSYGRNLNINLNLNLGDHLIDVSNAIPVSLIVNEFLSNAYKHAFEPERTNELTVLIKIAASNKINVTVQDNGPGLPDDYGEKGTGFELIEGLVDQIDGVLGVTSSNDGSKFVLEF